MEYNEDSFGNKRSYALDGDHVLFRGRNWLGSRSEVTIPLADLSPVYDRFWTKEPRRVLITLLAIVIVGSLLMWPVVYLDFNMRIYWGLVIAVVLVFATLAVFWPPTEYVLFKWKTGISALLVGRRGSDKSRFDEFVTTIQQAILARSNP